MVIKINQLQVIFIFLNLSGLRSIYYTFIVDLICAMSITPSTLRLQLGTYYWSYSELQERVAEERCLISCHLFSTSFWSCLNYSFPLLCSLKFYSISTLLWGTCLLKLLCYFFITPLLV